MDVIDNMQETYHLEFYYDEILIGIIYGLTEAEAEKLWDQWDNFKQECWCAIVFVADEYDE